MTLSEWLILATNELEQSGIETARLDCLVLLEKVLKIDRAKLLAEPDMEMTTENVSTLAKLLNRRTHHEPLAYLLGSVEFYGRNFVITPSVLVPRPESETMIDVLKKLPNISPNAHVADVGSGSGALGITAKLELPDIIVELLEIDKEASKIAQTNVDKYTMPIPVIRSDLLEQTTTNNDILLCNLPYVPDDFQINRAASIEPALALFGGPDGLGLYRKLFQQVSDLSRQPLYILTEALPAQHESLCEIAMQFGYIQLERDDFIQVFIKQ